MSVYSAITSGQVDSESPLDVTLAGQWTDNVLAIAEGDASAPSIANEALATYPIPAVSGVLGTWALIESWTPTAVNLKDFTWDEAVYSDITIAIVNVIPATDDVELRMRYGHTNGTVIITSTYQTRSMDFTTLAFSADTNQSYIALTYVDTTLHGVGTAAGESFSSTINLASTSAGRKTICKQDASFENSGGTSYISDLWADTTSIDAIDTVRLYWESGNFEVTGKIYVYGLKVA